MRISFQRLFYAIATVMIITGILILGRSIFVPLGFALLTAFILFPLAKKLESWGMNEMFAAFFSILIMFLIIGSGITFFSTQILNLSDQFSAFQEKIMHLFTDLIVYFNRNVSFGEDLNKDDLLAQSTAWLKGSAGAFVRDTFSSTASVITGLVAVIIYTFLLLIYRNGLTNAFAKFFPEKERERVINMFKNVQKVGQKYLSGMILLIFILGTANSIGLWIIGIDNPFLFGFLAATLSIIPYVGTTLGACIPVLYAFMSQDSLVMPLAVAIMFWSIQLIESNFLSPKVVGSSLQVNALAAIFSLILGALLWGVAGMILFLPFAAMLKVICEEYTQLKPIALLIGNQGEEEDDEKRARPLRDWFKKTWFRLTKKGTLKNTPTESDEKEF